jgi:hypothetical protein
MSRLREHRHARGSQREPDQIANYIAGDECHETLGASAEDAGENCTDTGTGCCRREKVGQTE